LQRLSPYIGFVQAMLPASLYVTKSTYKEDVDQK